MVNSKGGIITFASEYSPAVTLANWDNEYPGVFHIVWSMELTKEEYFIQHKIRKITDMIPDKLN